MLLLYIEYEISSSKRTQTNTKKGTQGMTAPKKLKLFDDNKLLKITKIIALACAGVLFIWFTFDMTGLKIGSTKIVTSAFKDEPIDFVFYLIFLACIVLLVIKDAIGKYATSIFLLFWGGFQFSMYFSSGKGIASYNETFADTHHIIAASADTLVKDTYHIFLDLFILLAFVASVTFLIAKLVLNKRTAKATEEQ